MSSPLFQEVREKRGLVYSIHTGCGNSVDHGSFVISGGTTPDKILEMTKVSCDVINNARTFITEGDLERARNSSLFAYSSIRESPRSVASFIVNNLFANEKIDNLSEIKNKISSVTLDDILNAGTAIFQSAPIVAMVGPVPDVDYLSIVRAVS